MKAAEVLPTPAGGAEGWPLSVEAYHVLGEARLIPERTELLYGFVYHKMSEDCLVLGREKQIEVHRQPREGQFTERTLYNPGERLTSAAFPNLTVDLSKLLESV